MDTRDREAIEGLFNRIEDVARQAGPRDAEAERLIAERLQRQPAAPYYLAQTVIMQDFALKTLQERVEALEKVAKAQPEATEGGGFFSRSAGFGVPSSSRASVPGVGSRGPWGQAEPQPGAHSPTPAPVADARPSQPSQQPYAPPPSYAPTSQGFGGMGGGGFLAGAAQTAVGVAGGVMLGSALGSMLGGHGGGLFGGGAGLAGGSVTDVTENVTNNIYEAPQGDVRDASDQTPSDDSGTDTGFQDATYDDPGLNDGFGGDEGGFDNV